MKVVTSLAFWGWLASGTLVAWAIQEQALGLSSLVVIVYGLGMAFMGFVMSLKQSQEKDRAADEARLQLQRKYQSALIRQSFNMRKALMYLTSRALSQAAGKLVAELLPQFDNEEQFDAAVECSKLIVEEEMAELEKVLGSIHPDDDDKKLDS
jgi:hypothetical protein